MEYWIDGYFIPWWTGKSYFSHDRQIFVPKYATIHRSSHRIHIKAYYAKRQINLAKNKYLDWSDRKDANLGLFVKALNIPWEKEPYIEPEPRFRVSLP